MDQCNGVNSVARQILVEIIWKDRAATRSRQPHHLEQTNERFASTPHPHVLLVEVIARKGIDIQWAREDLESDKIPFQRTSA
jgi:hypothetical protein